MKGNGTMLDNDHIYTMVTPQLAEQLLQHNTFNRAMKQGAAEAYAREMREGRWHRNGVPIMIGPNGELWNGQHRLWGIIEAQMTVPLVIIKNVPREALATIDTGLPRSYADYRKLSGKGEGLTVQYANELQAVLRLVHWYEKLWPAFTSGRSRLRATHLELDEILNRHPRLPEFIQHAASSDKLRRLGSIATTSFVYAMAAEAYPEQAHAWLEVLKTGDSDTVTHPANLLREQFMLARLTTKRTLTTDARFVYLTKSWNAFAQNKAIRSIRWQKEEPLPAIFGTPQYTGPRAGHQAVQRRRQEVKEKTRGQGHTVGSTIGKRRTAKIYRS